MLIALPTITYNNAIWLIQMLLSEYAWLSTFIGVLAVALGAAGRKKSPWGVALGITGIVWSLVPYWLIRRAAQLNDDSMREGLGDSYMQRIPSTLRARIAQTRWSLEVSAGSRRNVGGSTVEQDVAFHHTPQRVLLLDVYRPTAPPVTGDHYPAVIVVHGGSWRFGDKGEVFIPHNKYLASLGFVVFDVQYRLTEDKGIQWREPLDDLLAAVRWVKQYASAYRVDPQRVALLGRSAGGHLALQAAYRARDEAERVAAVVAIYPPTDLRMWMSDPNGDVARLLGGGTREAATAYADSSVLPLVRDGLPPTLLAHGYRDDLVMPGHSEMLHNYLAATDTTVVTLRLPWSRHGFDAFMSGLGGQVVQYDIDRFLAWALYKDC
jgi:acetyl esterase/lipase